MPDDDISAAEQAAFTETHDLILRLKTNPGYSSTDIGTGVFVSALSCLRKESSYAQVAKLLYEYADDYAVREHEN